MEMGLKDTDIFAFWSDSDLADLVHPSDINDCNITVL